MKSSSIICNGNVIVRLILFLTIQSTLTLITTINGQQQIDQLDDEQQQQMTNNQHNVHWQTITNLTVSNSGLVNYQLTTFTIDDESDRQISLIIQPNDVELVKDLVACDNIAYTIDPVRIYIQPINARKFSPIGLYGVKIFRTIGTTHLYEKKSIGCDWIRQQLLYTIQSRIEMIEFCDETSRPKVLVDRGPHQIITHLSLDPDHRLMLWTENIDWDQCRIMIASIDLKQHHSRPRSLYNITMSHCTAMTLDRESGLVYWVTRQQLWSMSYRTYNSVPRMILRNENLITDSIQIDGRYLYWSAMQRKILRIPIEFDSTLSSSSSSSTTTTTGNGDKVQLISQLGSQHLLLVAFRVTSIERNDKIGSGCIPHCRSSNDWSKTQMTTPISIHNNHGIHKSPSTLPSLNVVDDQNEQEALNTIWTEIRNYDWLSTKQLSTIIVTCLILLPINLFSSAIIYWCCGRQRHHSLRI